MFSSGAQGPPVQKRRNDCQALQLVTVERYCGAEHHHSMLQRRNCRRPQVCSKNVPRKGQPPSGLEEGDHAAPGGRRRCADHVSGHRRAPDGRRDPGKPAGVATSPVSSWAACYSPGWGNKTLRFKVTEPMPKGNPVLYLDIGCLCTVTLTACTVVSEAEVLERHHLLLIANVPTHWLSPSLAPRASLRLTP